MSRLIRTNQIARREGVLITKDPVYIVDGSFVFTDLESAADCAFAPRDSADVKNLAELRERLAHEAQDEPRYEAWEDRAARDAGVPRYGEL